MPGKSNVQISLKVQGVDKIIKALDHIQKGLARAWFEFQDVAHDTMEKTANVMKGRIENTRKRRKGEKSITDYLNVEKIGPQTAEVRLGIGNIQQLNKEVPYWYFINYGKMFTSGNSLPNYGKPVTPGSFDGEPPIKGASGQRWQAGKGEYTFKAKKPIEPKHYIEAGSEFLKREIKKVVKQYMNEIRKQLRK